MCDESGKVAKWYGTNTDIEDRKRAEDALRSHEENLRLLVDTIPGFVVTTKAGGEIELLNRRVLEYFDKTPEELANGPEVPLNFKNKIEASLTNEYVFDTTSKSGNFYYAWPQLTYSPLGWLQVGAVAQHTVAYHTPVSIQRGFLVGVSHIAWELTTYVFNPGISDTTVVLELGVSFKGP